MTQSLSSKLPPPRAESRLDEYREDILRMRRSKPPVSYRRIQAALAASGVKIALRTLYQFIERRQRPRATTHAPEPDQPATELTLPAAPNNATDPWAEKRELMRKAAREPIVPNVKEKKFSFTDEDCLKPYQLIQRKEN
jgi:hypothetical protein